MASSSVQRKFNAWLDVQLTRKIPRKVVAFSFNLYEPWCIELVGAGSFNEKDGDWACDEVFTSRGTNLDLAAKDVGRTWELVLKSAKKLLAAYLERKSAGSMALKSRGAVAVGFVDGDLEIVWRKWSAKTRQSGRPKQVGQNTSGLDS